MCESRSVCFGRHQVASKDSGQGVVIGEIKVSQAGDGNVQLHRVNAATKDAFLSTAFQDFSQCLDER